MCRDEVDSTKTSYRTTTHIRSLNEAEPTHDWGQGEAFRVEQMLSRYCSTTI